MGSDGVSGDQEIDAAIVRCLREWASPTSLRSLADLGPAALTRWIEIFRGRGRPLARPTDLDLPGSAEAEIWRIMIGALAQAHPGPFLDAVDAGRLDLGRDDTALLVTLGMIDDPRADAMLTGALASPDWLSRLHAVEGLAGRPGTGVRTALQGAASDPNAQVRDAVRKALARRRPRFGR